MLPNPPTRHLHQRLHLHQQRHQQHRRESKLLQDQRLDLLRPRLQAGPPPGPGSPSASLAGSLATLGPPCPAGPAIRTRDAAKPKGGGRARSASLHAGAGGATGGQGQGQGQGQAPPGGRRHSQARAARKAMTGGPGQGLSPFHPRGAFVLRTPLGVIDSSPELAGSPAGSMASMGSQACPRGGPPPPPPPPPGAGALSADANDSNSSSCLVLPYGAPCESFELAEIAYGEAAAPLARIATLETASIRDGDGVLDSGSDSVFGVPPTQHGQAPDTADQADTGVDTGQDADTDQDADGQLSTDSNGSGSSTPHQVVRHKPRLYVLPVGMAPVSGADSVTLHEAPHPAPHPQPGRTPSSERSRLRPRLARTAKVLAVSLDSAASDDCVTTTPEQSQEDPDQDAVSHPAAGMAGPNKAMTDQPPHRAPQNEGYTH